MPLVFTVIYFKNSRTTFKLHKSSQTFRDEFQHSPFRSKKKKKLWYLCLKPSPLSSHRCRLSSHRRRWSSVKSQPSPLSSHCRRLSSHRRRWSSHRRRWSSVKSQPSPIKLDGDPSHSFKPATIRLPGDPSHSQWPFAFLPSGPLSLSLSLNL